MEAGREGTGQQTSASLSASTAVSTSQHANVPALRKESEREQQGERGKQRLQLFYALQGLLLG